MYDQDEYFLYTGRLATASGLVGIVLGVLLSTLSGSGRFATIVVPIVFAYLFVTGFWGAYNLNQWFMRYRYRLPIVIWHIMRIPVLLVGVIAGVFGWGVLEHFVLLLAMDARFGLLGAQLILIPGIGRKIGQLLKYHPGAADPFRHMEG